ncbi:uncharacterized protein LOC126896618 [Daktulosphaira vitifoliae]|uniref:uncharacterized protein LOC126895636 n=1 Tax=Daktulosphaira vitifoliae TaxID=58002 RepID=UPI0021A99E1C|nr:uncharacterized protein LOC126895636 [Daktulosphaira vitifoliae]XP_050525516.1 uncharacterized protein LOC126896618 [Daktulosphaira vitifoliae]
MCDHHSHSIKSVITNMSSQSINNEEFLQILNNMRSEPLSPLLSEEEFADIINEMKIEPLSQTMSQELLPDFWNMDDYYLNIVNEIENPASYSMIDAGQHQTWLNETNQLNNESVNENCLYLGAHPWLNFDTEEDLLDLITQGTWVDDVKTSDYQEMIKDVRSWNNEFDDEECARETDELSLAVFKEYEQKHWKKKKLNNYFNNNSNK